jgi:polysaccharide biosynthesis transport protein
MSINNSSDEQYEEGIDLRQYLSLFLHWAWLIVLAALIAAAASYFYSQRLTKIYQSATTALVNEAPATKVTDYSSVMLSEQLTTTYAQMMNKDSVLSKVESQLGLKIPLADLKDMITVTPVTSTQLITVTVQSDDPHLSADIANAVVTVFANQIQDIQLSRFSQSETSLKAQMDDITTQINSYEARASAAVLQDEKDRLNTQIDQYQQIYTNLQQSYESVLLSEAQSVSSVVQIEPATANLTPVKPKVMQNTLLAAVIGFLLAAGVIVAREALDDTIKTPDDISKKFKLSVLGVINHHNPENDAPITQTDPRSPTAEAYRSLRTNVNYASVDRPLRTLMITSPEPGEGKTTTTCNLGLALAQNGAQVIIADCDLRHPRVHKYFGLSNRKGMANLFAQPDEVLDGALQSTSVEKLSIVTTGSLPPNPAELLGSQKMQRLLASMRETSDIILVDTPPALAVTDAAVLAPTLDGVLIVVRPGKTRASALRLTLEKMQQVNARVLGVVLNDIDIRNQPYTYSYHYYRNYSAYQHYYGGKEEKAVKKEAKVS